jgi:hypothetical protein
MSERTIKDAIRTLSGVNIDQVSLVSADIVSVNEGARTCTVNTTGERGTVQLEGVQLMASVDDGLLIIPVIGSTVLVCYSTYNKGVIVQYSGVDHVVLNAATGIQLNDGSFGGVVKVGALINKLNNIENSINALKTIFSGWSPVPNDGGAALKTFATVWAAARLTNSLRADIENTTINHGV